MKKREIEPSVASNAPRKHQSPKPIAGIPCGYETRSRLEVWVDDWIARRELKRRQKNDENGSKR